MRTRAWEKGHDNLMGAPTMHVVLDAMEQLGLESAMSGVKSNAEAQSAMASFYAKLYRPDPTAYKVNGEGYMPPPPGFSDEEMEASFDAFLSSGAR
ncbi:hypothetical protein SEA_ALANGRANT_38 [Mycobacterium phage AlanGrant]|uniref:Uncharacterized protein n=1 Tax=Mycobacterium phage AlanGrant TaxID=1647307 RepID=A0A0F6WEF4_9CAUD|nr:hypothetical protein SEA_ALANGRANT_38 [Mycobacterium phage AlanGrant]